MLDLFTIILLIIKYFCANLEEKSKSKPVIKTLAIETIGKKIKIINNSINENVSSTDEDVAKESVVTAAQQNTEFSATEIVIVGDTVYENSTADLTSNEHYIQIEEELLQLDGNILQLDDIILDKNIASEPPLDIKLIQSADALLSESSLNEMEIDTTPVLSHDPLLDEKSLSIGTSSNIRESGALNLEAEDPSLISDIISKPIENGESVTDSSAVLNKDQTGLLIMINFISIIEILF